METSYHEIVKSILLRRYSSNVITKAPPYKLRIELIQNFNKAQALLEQWSLFISEQTMLKHASLDLSHYVTSHEHLFKRLGRSALSCDYTINFIKEKPMKAKLPESLTFTQLAINICKNYTADDVNKASKILEEFQKTLQNAESISRHLRLTGTDYDFIKQLTEYINETMNSPKDTAKLLEAIENQLKMKLLDDLI